MGNNENTKLENEGSEKKSLQTTIAVPPFLLGNETTTQTIVPSTTTEEGGSTNADTGSPDEKDG
jgi:hypothetical protein